MTIRLAYACTEGTGNTVSPTIGDAIGTGTALVWTTGPLGGDGALNRTVGEDGQQRVTFPSDLPDDVENWGEFTILLWSRPLASGSSSRFPVVGYEGVPGADDWLGLEIDSAGQVRWWLGPTESDGMLDFSATTVPNDEWRHHALTWDGTTARMYIGGILAGSKALTTGGLRALTSMHMNGAQWESTGGAMTHIGVADHAMSALEIRALMEIPATEWADPEPVPLDTPVVTLVGTTPESAPDEADGTITVSWPDVDDADHYQAGIADGHDQTSGFIVVEESATSPHVFEELERGDYTPAIRAMPADELLLMRGSSDWGTPE